jgi:tetratricopeptide (TPR) repeat protein
MSPACHLRELEIAVSPRRRRLPVRPRTEPVGPWGLYVDHLRISRGWKYKQMYDAVNAAAQAEGEKNFHASRATIRRWIGGVAPTSTETIRWIATGWNVPIETIIEKTEAQRTWRYDQRVQAVADAETRYPGVQDQPTQASPPSDTIPVYAPLDRFANEAPDIREDQDTNRRTFILGGVAAFLRLSTDPALKAIERIRELDGIPAGATLDSLEELIADLGLASLRVNADNQYSRIDSAIEYVDALMKLDLLPMHSRRLLSVAGWLSGLAANAQLDVGDVAAARANCRAALAFGKRADNPRLAAWASDRHAKVAFYTGDLAAVLKHTEHGLSVVPRPTGLEVGLLGASARAYARLGDGQRAKATLREAQAEFERLPSSEIGGGLFLISQIYQAACASETTVWLDESALTRQFALDVIDYFTTADPLSRRPTRLAIAHLDLAAALAQAGTPDEASHFATLALTTERMVSSVATRAADVDSRLQARWRHVREVREFHEQYEQMTHNPPSRALPRATAEA